MGFPQVVQTGLNFLQPLVNGGQSTNQWNVRQPIRDPQGFLWGQASQWLPGTTPVAAEHEPVNPPTYDWESITATASGLPESAREAFITNQVLLPQAAYFGEQAAQRNYERGVKLADLDFQRQRAGAMAMLPHRERIAMINAMPQMAQALNIGGGESRLERKIIPYSEVTAYERDRIG